MNNNASYTKAMTQARMTRRGPDIQDVQQIADEYHAGGRLRQLCDEFASDGGSALGRAAMGGLRRHGSGREMTYGGRVAGEHAEMGARRGEPGSSAAIIRRGATVADYNTRVPHYPVDPSCQAPQDCAGDLLGFNTLSVGAFPLAAPVAPAVVTQGQLNVGSATSDKYIPRYLFWEGRDVNQNFAVVPSLLVQANIGPNQQTVGSGVFNSITSAVFALTLAPLPVGWDAFRNVDGQTLLMTFGTFIGAASVQFFGCLWGDAGIVGQ